MTSFVPDIADGQQRKCGYRWPRFMLVVVIGAVGRQKRRFVVRVATERGKDNSDAGLRVAPDAAGVGTLAEPIHAPVPVIRRQLWKVRQGVHRLSSSPYLWRVAQSHVQ